MDVRRTPEPEELSATAEHLTEVVTAAKKARWTPIVDDMMSKFYAFIHSLEFDHPAGKNIAVSWVQVLINEFFIDLNANKVGDLEVSNIMYCIEAVSTALGSVHTAFTDGETTQQDSTQMCTEETSLATHDQATFPQEDIVASEFEATPSDHDAETARFNLFSRHVTIFDGQMHPMASTGRIWADLLLDEIPKRKITPMRLAFFLDALRQIRIASYIVEEMYRTRDHNAMMNAMMKNIE